MTQADIREGKRRKARAIAAAKAAYPRRADKWESLASLSAHVAAQRRAAEHAAERRIAVGAEAQSAPRPMQLLPGAAEAAECLAETGRYGQASAAVERDLWGLLAYREDPAPVEPSPADIQERWLRELADIGPGETLAPSVGQIQERLLHELRDVPSLAGEEGGRCA